MQRFLSDVKRHPHYFVGLPAAALNAVFILVLLVGRVTVQAAWVDNPAVVISPEHARIESSHPPFQGRFDKLASDPIWGYAPDRRALKHMDLSVAEIDDNRDLE
jgi:hypothetical protein